MYQKKNPESTLSLLSLYVAPYAYSHLHAGEKMSVKNPCNPVYNIMYSISTMYKHSVDYIMILRKKSLTKQAPTKIYLLSSPAFTWYFSYFLTNTALVVYILCGGIYYNIL